MKMGTFLTKNLLITILATGVLNIAHANNPAGTGDGKEGSSCEAAIGTGDSAKTTKAGTSKRKTAAATKSGEAETAPIKRKIWKLSDFLNENPTENLAAKHPFTVLSAVQKYWPIVNLVKPRLVKDPLYRVNDTYLYPVFTGELPSSNGNMIIGQEDAMQELITYLHSRARGDKSSKMAMLVGPGGTGKTEAMQVLDWNRNWLSMNDERFFEFTYEFVDLNTINYLKPLGPFVPSEFGRSPFTLLREDIQDKVLSIARSDVEAFVGYKLKEWRNPDHKAAEIIEAIFKHYYPSIALGEMEISDLSQEDYLKTLEKHVRVVRRKRDYKRKPANIVRFVPENPNYEQLFVSENIRLKPFYPVSSALVYDFSGIVSQQDGGALIFDEFPRNDVNLLNTNLEIAQNGVVQAGIGPAYDLDTFTLLTANDESVDDARERAAIKALMDRTHTIPTRHLLHPYQIAKAFLYTYGTSQFLMKKLTVSDVEKAANKESKVPVVSKIEPLVLSTVYPFQDNDGKLLGVDGRYGVYYRYDNSRNVLISPHTLEMLGLVVSSTRLVTDVAAMQAHWSEMQVLSPRSHLYTSAKSRLKVIMGEINPEDEVRKDLFRVRYLMREGEKGISHRDMESWFKTALELTVQKRRSALTPMILDEAFKSIFDKETVKPDNKNLRATWLNRYRMVKTEFIMPALFKDIRKIVSGDGEKAERIYDQIVKEIITLSQNPEAKEWMPEDGSGPQQIKDKRLREVKEKFKELHSFEFSDSFLLRHLGGASSGKGISRNQELLEAIQAWLVETEADVADLANQIASYYEGHNQDPNVEQKVKEAEDRMGAYGYDAQSFSEAIIFWKKLVYENTRNKKDEQ